MEFLGGDHRFQFKWEGVQWLRDRGSQDGRGTLNERSIDTGEEL